MKAHESLVQYALDNNATVSVWDGEEWQLKRSSNYNDILEAINSVDISELRFRDKDQDVVILGWALIVLDNEDYATVSDYTITPFMTAWEETQE
jgi:hypothetical protein